MTFWELFQQPTFVALAAACHGPLWISQCRLMERQEYPDLVFVRLEKGHVILNRIQCSQYKVEDEYVHQ